MKCRFGYTPDTCGDKFEPPCGGNCEFTSRSLNGVKPKSYNEIHNHR